MADSVLMAMVTVFALTLLQTVVTLGFTTKMSDVTNLLEPCNDECVHFRLFGDKVFNSTTYNLSWAVFKDSFVQPFRMAPPNHTQCHKLIFVRNGHELETMDKCPDDSFVNAMPSPVCSGWSIEDMQDHCETKRARGKVINMVFGSTSMIWFVTTTALWGLSRAVHDMLVLWSGGVDMQLVFPVLIFNFVVSTLMACSALLWSTGALGLFVAPHEDCACYYKLRDIPALLFLAIPVSLTINAISKGRDVLLALFIGGPYLMSISYHIPHRLVVSTSLSPTGSLLGITGAGQGATPQDIKWWSIKGRGRMLRKLLTSLVFLLMMAVELSSAPLTLRLIQFTSLDLHEGLHASIALGMGMVGGVIAYLIYLFSVAYPTFKQIQMAPRFEQIDAPGDSPAE